MTKLARYSACVRRCDDFASRGSIAWNGSLIKKVWFITTAAHACCTLSPGRHDQSWGMRQRTSHLVPI
jgi:hypothetical protein